MSQSLEENRHKVRSSCSICNRLYRGILDNCRDMADSRWPRLSGNDSHSLQLNKERRILYLATVETPLLLIMSSASLQRRPNRTGGSLHGLVRVPPLACRRHGTGAALLSSPLLQHIRWGLTRWSPHSSHFFCNEVVAILLRCFPASLETGNVELRILACSASPSRKQPRLPGRSRCLLNGADDS